MSIQILCPFLNLAVLFLLGFKSSLCILEMNSNIPPSGGDKGFLFYLVVPFIFEREY